MRFAVAGFGYWAPNIVRAVARVIGPENIVVAEPRKERQAAIEEQFPAVGIENNIDTLIDDPGISALAICTPADTHQKFALAGLNAGKHVFVEKPFATSLDNALDILRLAKSKSLVSFPGHVHLHTPFVDFLKTTIKDGVIGNVRFVVAQRASHGPRAREDVGASWDYLIHDVYIACHLIGEAPAKVTASGAAYLRSGIEDCVFATLTFSGGEVFNLYASWHAPRRIRRFSLTASNGGIDHDESRQDQTYLTRTGFRNAEGIDAQGNAGLQYFDDGEEQVTLPESDEPLVREISAFVEAIRKGETPADVVENVLATTATMEAIDASISAGGAPVSPVRVQSV